MRKSVTRITIIGMGLIGGSLGLAFKAAQDGKIEVTGVDTNELSLVKARQRGAADVVTSDFKASVVNADMVFLCTPVLQVPALVKEIAPYLKQGAILTDTGSTKGYLIKEILALLPSGVAYVPGHPMAGRERSGIEAAEATLFKEKWYILIPDDTYNNAAAIEAVRKVVAWTGAIITVMDAAQHDWSVALISHIPHIGAAALVNLLMYAEDEDSSVKLSGGGFRDTTRIASSNADMWADVCMTNTVPIADNLEKLCNMIGQIAVAVRQGDRASLHHFFATAKKRRDALLMLEQSTIEQPSPNDVNKQKE